MAFRRFGSAEVLSVHSPSGTETLRKSAHRAVFSYVPRDGYIYVRSRAISSRCNDNFDFFGADEIKKSYLTFIGKPVFVNHHNSDHKQARGVIIAAALHEDRLPDGGPDTWAEVLMEVDAVTYPRLAMALVNGDIDRTSMGCDVEISKCSACGNVAKNPLEYCKHIPGMKGKKIVQSDGLGNRTAKLVYEECYGLKFFENSLLVEPPADPTAFFLGKVDVGPGLEHLAAKAARLTAVTQETSVPVEPNPMQRTASRRTAEIDPQHPVEKLLEGMHQITNPGSTPASRNSDRNMQVMDSLHLHGYQPHQIKFDENDDDHPYGETEHKLPSGHPSGWTMRDYSGPHLEIHHRATGNEAHDMVNIESNHNPSAMPWENNRAVGYGAHEAEQDLNAWHEDHESGTREYLEGSDPRIKRWKGRKHFGSRPRRRTTAAANDSHIAQMSAVNLHDHLHSIEDNPHAQLGGMSWYHHGNQIVHALSDIYKQPPHKVAGIIAAYSPKSAPAPNLSSAISALHAGEAATPENHTGPLALGLWEQAKPKVDAMFKDKDFDPEKPHEFFQRHLGHVKTSNFGQNLYDPSNPHPVTTDTHHAAALAGWKGVSGQFGGGVFSGGYGKDGSPTAGQKRYNTTVSMTHQATDALNHHPEFAGFRKSLDDHGLYLPFNHGKQVLPHQTQALVWAPQQQRSKAAMETKNVKALETVGQNSVDKLQDHYVHRDNPFSMLHPDNWKSFFGATPRSMQQQAAVRRRMAERESIRVAYNEIKAPVDVNTLREESCPICSNNTAFDGNECMICGYIAPPKPLGDPDVDKAKELDQLKQNVDDQRDGSGLDPSQPGADFEAGDPDQAMPGGDNSNQPWLACPDCTTELRPAAAQTVSTEPGGQDGEVAPEGPTEGGQCPVCGGGPLQSTGQSEDDTDEMADEEAEEEADEADGDPDEEAAEDPEDDEEEDPNVRPRARAN